MTQQESVEHWRTRAEAELKAAQVLMQQKDDRLYGEVIFHCHLALELAFKSLFIQEKQTPAPFTHNLSDLASALSLEWTEDEQDDLDELSENAILSRYGDARWFEREATKERAAFWLQRTEEYLSRILP